MRYQSLRGRAPETFDPTQLDYDNTPAVVLPSNVCASRIKTQSMPGVVRSRRAQLAIRDKAARIGVVQASTIFLPKNIALSIRTG